jgi:alpha-galactosidase
VYVVGCGAPLLPSVGLVDAMRVSPDTFHEGGEDGSHGLRGLMPLAARAWQQGRWWVNDPDCVVARPSYAERERWADAVADLGGLVSFSDRVAELDERGLRRVRDLLVSRGTAEPFAPDTVRHGALVAAHELTARQEAPR